jgi:leucine-rich repeat kinase 1/leucine-rich repeat kinase 2
MFSRRDAKFPMKFFQQYLILLYRFEIALPLDKTRILITSMLDSKRPSNVDVEEFQDPPYHTRYIIFGSAETPPGFWSRYLSRIMHSISKATDALLLKTTTAGTVIQSMSLGVSGSTSDNPISSPLKYWESGLFFSDAEVVFRVESLSGSKMQSVTDEHGILIVASPNNLGIKIIGQLIDMALSLLREMYPGLTEISQRIPCYECVRRRTAVKNNYGRHSHSIYELGRKWKYKRQPHIIPTEILGVWLVLQ